MHPAAAGVGLCLSFSTLAAALPVLELQPGTARPGDTVLATVADGGFPPTGTAGGKQLHFFASRDRYQTLFSLPLEQPLGRLPIEIRGVVEDGGTDSGTDGLISAELEVVDPHFPSRELTVASKFLRPPASVKKRLEEDRKAIDKAYSHKFQPPLFERNFLWPRPADFTSHFGDLRLYNGKKESQHYGSDLDGRIGDLVVAANDGVVTLARDCYSSGNTILIHHGVELYSAYFHLSHMDVKVGSTVHRGQKIGEVGKTGRVTGPHLHFGIKLAGHYVDPESLLRLNFE